MSTTDGGSVSAGSDSGEAPVTATEPTASEPSGTELQQQEQTFTQTDVEKIVGERLARERKKYSDYAELKNAASKAKTVEEQLSELRKAMSDRDVADVQKAGRLAVAQVHAALAEAGIGREDVSGLLEHVDAMSLLADGEPDDAAIAKLAKSLTKIAGRTTPDRDQGRKGGDAPADMNELFRRAVQRG